MEGKNNILSFEAVKAAAANDNRKNEFNLFGAHLSLKNPADCKKSVEKLLDKLNYFVKNLRVLHTDLVRLVAADKKEEDLVAEIAALQALLAAKQEAVEA